MIGSHMIKAQTKGQAVIALSTGEAEYYGLVSGISALLGLTAIAQDWHHRFKMHVWMDATTGISIGSRRGLGKVKHIDTVFLWVQEVVLRKDVRLGKKHTSEMLADMLTKFLDENTMIRLLTGLGFKFRTGNHKLALTT